MMLVIVIIALWIVGGGVCALLNGADHTWDALPFNLADRLDYNDVECAAATFLLWPLVLGYCLFEIAS